MKKIILIVAFLGFLGANAQAYKGKGDKKIHIGTALQENATGVNFSFDYGLGENFSVGLSSVYALGLSEAVSNAKFVDRFDLRAKLNANLGSIINIDDNFDIYPGLNFGLKNFGGHLGLRYFFSDGFGIYSEFMFPLSKYKTGRLNAIDLLNNQFTANLGFVFNL